MKLARSAGLLADPWQASAAADILSLDAEGRFVHFEAGLNVARQNGKGVVLEVVELDALFNWPGRTTIIHSAHEFATAQEHQLRLEAVIQQTPALHVRVKDRGGYKHANGQESINLKDGSRIIFKARTKGGSRGFSADLLVWDEAMDLPAEVVAAMMPTLRASDAPHGPMLIYAGSAVDLEVHDHGIVWARVRERGLAGEPGLAYIEYSAHVGDPVDDDPDLAVDEVLLDRVRWREANPGLGSRIPEEHMALEMSSMLPRKAAVELMGIGAWPRTDGMSETVFPIETWDALTDPGSKLQQPIVLAFDISPERRTSIAAAGLNERGEFHVEIHENRAGTSWVAERLAEMTEAASIEAIVCDSVGPAASLLQQLDRAGVKVETLSSTEHGQACGRFVDLVTEGSLRHLGSLELRDAIRGAKTRPLGDSFAWSRKSSATDISALVAATLALWGAQVLAGVGDMEIVW